MTEEQCFLFEMTFLTYLVEFANTLGRFLPTKKRVDVAFTLLYSNLMLEPIRTDHRDTR